MNILDIFKRHKDEGFDDLKSDLSMKDEQPSSYGFEASGQDSQPTMPGPSNQHYQGGYGMQNYPSSQPAPQDMVSKELEIISSKLDSIRAMLESLNQRVSSLERVAYGDQSYGNQRRY